MPSVDIELHYIIRIYVRNALLDDYTPERLVGRGDELEKYHKALQPAINQSQFDIIFLYGKTGVGKTAATKFLLGRLEESSSQYNITVNTLIVNCDELDTSYSVAVELVNTFADEKISETGHPRSKVYNEMWTAIDVLGGLLILVMDEIEHIQDDSLLYQLSRARENNNISNSRVSVIGISNDLSYRETLSPKVRSSLCERSIHFPAYNAAEFEEVSRQRIDIAFQDGTIDGGVVQLCAAYGARESGDARKALDLLLKAKNIAQETDADSVTEEHVRERKDILEREAVKDGILGLNEQERVLLYSLASFDGDSVRSRKLYDRYTKIADYGARDEMSKRWMHNHLDAMDMLGLLTVDNRNEGSSGGKYNEISLDQDVELVLDALDGTIETIGVHESVQESLGGY